MRMASAQHVKRVPVRVRASNEEETASRSPRFAGVRTAVAPVLQSATRLVPTQKLQSLTNSIADTKAELSTAVASNPAVQQYQQLVDKYWDSLPARYKIVAAASLSFVICNMDKVNMSVAIIPMAHEFGWSPSTAGLVQSAFFWGYILCQLPGGYLSSRFGGRKVLPAGVGLWSLATAGVPLLAATVPGLCFSRALVGLGEAVAPSAATDMVSRTVPAEERARAVSAIFAGLHVGSILGLLAAPALITHLGWESVFYAFGVAGLFWCWWFDGMVRSLAASHPEAVAALEENRLEVAGSTTSAPVPYRAFVRSRPVQALMFTHFCNNWFHYTMLAWLPSYFVDTLSVDLMHAAQTALLPPLAGIVASSLAGPAADTLIACGWPVARVRKLAQCVAFLVPSACLLAAMTSEDSTTTVALITAALGISSFSLAGLYCNHQDLSPRYASALLGLTNTTGAIPGIIGVAVTGMLFDQTGSWGWSLFAPSIVFFLAGSAVYTLYGRSEPTDFDVEELNQPFAVEGVLAGWRAAADEKLQPVKAQLDEAKVAVNEAGEKLRTLLRL